MVSNLCCATCTAWLAQDRATAYTAPCAKGVYTGRVPFDTTGCEEHSALVKPAPPVVDMQSQVRGFWRQYQP